MAKRKVVVQLDDDGQLYDMNGVMMLSTSGMNYNMPDIEEGREDIVKLVSLGVTPDDLLKMKACGII